MGKKRLTDYTHIQSEADKKRVFVAAIILYYRITTILSIYATYD